MYISLQLTRAVGLWFMDVYFQCFSLSFSLLMFGAIFVTGVRC